MKKKVKTKKKKLTKKENDFAIEYAKTGNGVQSALKTYNTKSYKTASTIADANLDKPRVQAKIESIADHIPDELLVEKHLELLNVPRITKTRRRGKETEIEESTDVQALKAGLDMAYKLKGSYEPQEINMKFKGFSKEQLIENIMNKIAKKK